MKPSKATRDWNKYELRGTHHGAGTQEQDRVKELMDPMPHLSLTYVNVAEEWDGDEGYKLVYKSDLPEEEAREKAEEVMSEAMPGAVSSWFKTAWRFTDEVVLESAKDLGKLTEKTINKTPSMLKSVATIAVVIGGIYALSKFKK